MKKILFCIFYCFTSTVVAQSGSDLGQFLDEVVSGINGETVESLNTWNNPDKTTQSSQSNINIPELKTTLAKPRNAFLIRNETGQMQLFKINAEGRFVLLPVIVPNLRKTTVAYDLNQDGIDELITPIDSQHLQIHAWSDKTLTLYETLKTPVIYINFWIADFDGDNKMDLMLQDSKGDMHWLYFRQQHLEYVGKVAENWHYSHYFVGDWDGDGYSDYLVRDTQGTLFLIAFRRGKFHQPQQLATDWHYQQYFAGDWNQDGMMDMVARTATGDLDFYFMRRNNLVKQAQIATHWQKQRYFVADWNRDGRSDMLVQEPQYLSLYTLENNQLTLQQQMRHASPFSLYIPLLH